MSRLFEEVREDLAAAIASKDPARVTALCEELRKDHDDVDGAPYSGITEAQEAIDEAYKQVLSSVWDNGDKSSNAVLKSLRENGADIRVVGEVMLEKGDRYASEGWVSWGKRKIKGGYNQAATDELQIIYDQVADYRPEKIEFLIQEGADVNVAYKDGNTALHLAAVAGHAAVVRALADAGAKLDAVDMYGGTALHKAAYKGACRYSW